MGEKILDYGEIYIEKICLELSGKKILNNVSLKMNSGKIHVILGKSGSGKTSLLNVMNGLYIPTSGNYYFGENKIDYGNENEIDELRKKIGYFHQELALIENITLEENLKIFAKIRGQVLEEKKIAEQLEKMKISYLYRQNISTLSGGERQRAAFLKLLLFDYPVVLIDEPTNNLDSENVEYMIQAIRQLGKMKKNVIIVSHSEKVKEIADVVYRMEKINGRE